MSARDLNFPGLDIDQKSAECISKLDAYIQRQFDALIDKFLDQFKQYCNKITWMQEAGQKGSVGFIHFSVLRTNILAARHKFRLDAYDSNWYMDRTECSGEYDVQEYYAYLDEFADALEVSRNVSKGGINLRDVQRVVFGESNKYLLLVAELIRVGLRQASEEQWFQAIKRHEVFVICIGEYQDKVDILYKEDTTAKDAKEVKRFLESKHQPAYSHEICIDLDLTCGKYEDICLQFSTFDGSDLSDSRLKNGKIICSSFKRAVLKNVDFNRAQIFDADFSGAILEDVSFDKAQLNHVSFAGATLARVRFEGALWVQALDFNNAELIDTIIPEESKKPVR